MLLPLLLLALGFLLLIKGADWLVVGASALAKKIGVAPIVIGLTIVAFGTSMPELVVNLVAAVQGRTDIAIGNILGSNIANILLILGISGCICQLTVNRNTTWKEVPMALLAVVLVWVLANDRLISGASADRLDRGDGLVLLAFFGLFLYYTKSISRVGGDTAEVEQKTGVNHWLLILAGLAALVGGGKLAVDGAVAIARDLGISERTIGLTVVAIGTSLPELLTSAVAAWRRQSDIAIGNVVGSNIFNVFWILGISSLIRPLPFSAASSFDALIAIGATAVLFGAMFIGKKHVLERWQAALFLSAYAAYVGWLIAA